MTNSLNEHQNLDTSMPTDVQVPKDEIDFLDLLQTIVDNLRLLVLGPLLVGVMGYLLFGAADLYGQDTIPTASTATKCCSQYVGQSWQLGWIGRHCRCH